MRKTFKVQKRKRKASNSTSAGIGILTWIRDVLPSGRLSRLDECGLATIENEPYPTPSPSIEVVTDSDTEDRSSQCGADLEAAVPDKPTIMALPLAPSAHHLPPYMINMLHHSANNHNAHSYSAKKAPYEVEMRYPSGYTERFLLPDPSKATTRAHQDRFLEPIDDLTTTISVILHLGTGPIGPHIKLCPILKTAYENSNTTLFRDTLATLNTLLATPLKLTRPSQPLIHHFFAQLYDRSVAPHTKRLSSRHSSKTTNSVYGELQPAFLSRIFKQTALGPGSVYLDLGSGVGNTAMQAALETGAEAHGIEREDFPHLVSALHLQQFHIRCMLWGLKPGKVQLYHGDFLRSPHLTNFLLPEADVVVVNNFKFEPETDLELEALLEDRLKVGARVVSMRPVVLGNSRGLAKKGKWEGGLWRVEECGYEEESVSWSGREGRYWVSTKLR